MKINKKINKIHQGYQLQHFAKSLLTVKEIIKFYTPLKRVPYKISCFIKRETIKKVFKHDNFTYYVIDNHNDVFILDY